MITKKRYPVTVIALSLAVAALAGLIIGITVLRTVTPGTSVTVY